MKLSLVCFLFLLVSFFVNPEKVFAQAEYIAANIRTVVARTGAGSAPTPRYTSAHQHHDVQEPGDA